MINFFFKHKKVSLTIFIFLIFFLFLIKTRALVFTLSPKQVDDYLAKSNSTCQNIEACEIMPGDIMIRKYSTSRTKLLEMFIRPYFTHSGFYYGNGIIIEAVGNEPDKNNEIIAQNLYTSDWTQQKLEKWVIIRPILPEAKMKEIGHKILAIANDQTYTFGIRLRDDKKYTCASLIFDQFEKEGIVNSNKKIIETPDYIFKYAATHPEAFTIIGFN